ncbi:MAG: hypothetical protein QXD29_00740 [Thermoplasmata archaeon]
MSDQEVIKQTNKYTVIRKETGEEAYICNLCEKEVDKKFIAIHFNPRHPHCCEKIKEQIAKERSIAQSKDDFLARLRGETDEVTYAMAETLYEQLLNTPSTSRYKERIEWIVKYFVKNKLMQENPQRLYEVLSEQFKSATDHELNFIIDTVFDIKSQYVRDRRGYLTYQRQPHFYTPVYVQQPQDQTTWLLQMMFERMLSMFDKTKEKETSVDIQKMIEAEVERRFLRERVEKLEGMIDSLLKNEKRSSDGWRDDYAHIIHDLGQQLLEMGEKVLVENRKFRQSLLKLIFIEEKREPSGKTDEGIVKELEKEGLVE